MTIFISLLVVFFGFSLGDECSRPLCSDPNEDPKTSQCPCLGYNAEMVRDKRGFKWELMLFRLMPKQSNTWMYTPHMWQECDFTTGFELLKDGQEANYENCIAGCERKLNCVGFDMHYWSGTCVGHLTNEYCKDNLEPQLPVENFDDWNVGSVYFDRAEPVTRPATDEGEICPAGCFSWFDGCNDCDCNGVGKIGDCTKRKCNVKGVPRCDVNPPQPKTKCEGGCTFFTDGCNRCRCKNDKMVCGEAYCAEYGEAKCLDSSDHLLYQCDDETFCCPAGSKCMLPRGGDKKMCVGNGDRWMNAVECGLSICSTLGSPKKCLLEPACEWKDRDCVDGVAPDDRISYDELAGLCLQNLEDEDACYEYCGGKWKNGVCRFIYDSKKKVKCHYVLNGELCRAIGCDFVDNECGGKPWKKWE